MKKTALVIALIFLAVFCVFKFASAVNYPKPVGFVNDFAGILSQDVKNKLESELREYEKKTSIEIAVVTVKSLEGETVEDYTIGLAKSWGVGKKEKDNGIVLLVAPNERKMRIEVGYGMEPDMPDSAAGRIVRDGIIPLFKEGKMSDGIVVGVAEILKTIGDKPYQARLEERRAAEEKARLESEQSWESFKNFMWIAMIILTLGAAIFSAVALGRSTLRRRRELKTLHKKNGEMLAGALKKIDEADGKYPPAKEKLELFKQKNPKEIWQRLEILITPIPGQINDMAKQYKSVAEEYDKGWKNAEKTGGFIQDLHNSAAEKISSLESIDSAIKEVDEAKKKSAKLLQLIPISLERIEPKIFHPDVSADTRKLLNEAKAKYADMPKLYDKPDALVNWLLVFSALGALSMLIGKADSAIESDKAWAGRARKEGPELLKKIPGMLKATQEKVSHKDVSEDTRKQLTAAKNKYEDAKRKADNSPINWLIVFAALNLAASWIHNAENQAVSEIEAVARRKRRQREEKESRRRRDSDSSSWSSSSSSSSSSSGPSFSGFGGGGFGGGGASGSW